MMEFPTATNLTEYLGFCGEGLNFVPRVHAGTHVPPVFGKETPAGSPPSPPPFPFTWNQSRMDVLTDKFGRAITDLRISITDRCNYKCVYCRTGNEGALYGDLPFADYLRMARILVGLGIKKVRITGGEPLLRKGVVDFIRDLSKLQTIDREPLDIAMTTNGHMLAEMAQPLKAAGLTRVTVSMDAVDPDRFARITRVHNGFDQVLAGIRTARRTGLWPVKVNCVLMRGFNEDQIIPFGMFAREEGVVVRFIEFMPLEEDRVWSPQTVVKLDEIVARMRSEERR